MQTFSTWFTMLGWAAVSAIVATPSLAANQIAVSYNSLSIEIPVTDLETLAQEGSLPPSLAFYGAIAPPAQIASAQSLLAQTLDVDSESLAQFLSLPEGEHILGRLGNLLQTELSEPERTELLRGSIMAASQEGLSLLNVIRQFPGETLALDLKTTLALVEENTRLYGEQATVIQALWESANSIALSSTVLPPNVDLSKSGLQPWEKRSFQLPARGSSRAMTPSLFDLYQPIVAAEMNLPGRSLAQPPDMPSITTQTSVIVISHGLGGDRQTLAYLAEHLASHGFAAVVLEHPATNRDRFSRFLEGMASPPPAGELVNRPHQVSAALDALTTAAATDPQLQQLNLTKVGILGQSLGGYTALAAAGARVNPPLLKQTCIADSAEKMLTLNLSLPLQCRLLELPDIAGETLQDSRIAAVMALNPLTSSIFGPAGLRQLEMPVMLMAGTQDHFTPAIAEQITPFGWLQTPEKYLFVAKNATHFSLIDAPPSSMSFLPQSFIGPKPSLAFPAVQAISVAFFGHHLEDRAQYKNYLTQNYVQTLAQDPFAFSLVDHLP